jgi:hypothetical protein
MSILGHGKFTDGVDGMIEVILAIVGTGTLLYLGWFIYLLHSKPWVLWKMNQLIDGVSFPLLLAFLFSSSQ